MSVQTEQQLVAQMKTASTQLGPIFVNVNQVQLKLGRISLALSHLNSLVFELKIN